MIVIIHRVSRAYIGILPVILLMAGLMVSGPLGE